MQSPPVTKWFLCEVCVLSEKIMYRAFHLDVPFLAPSLRLLRKSRSVSKNFTRVGELCSASQRAFHFWLLLSGCFAKVVQVPKIPLGREKRVRFLGGRFILARSLWLLRKSRSGSNNSTREGRTSSSLGGRFMFGSFSPVALQKSFRFQKFHSGGRSEFVFSAGVPFLKKTNMTKNRYIYTAVSVFVINGI
ncbi:hypothetical protein SAMN05518848_104528 [Paenibacillus sp. PDC88]|nr:hypothetical protein SAMN05518848_104528 [Paenibacillus sp. PDC88]